MRRFQAPHVRRIYSIPLTLRPFVPRSWPDADATASCSYSSSRLKPAPMRECTCSYSELL